MTVPSLAAVLAQRVGAAASSVAETSETVDPQVRRSEHADFQADGVLALARTQRRNPRELGAAVAAAVSADPLLAAATVAGPGFVNLTLAGGALRAQLATRQGEGRLGVPAPETGRVTVIDYSHPNIAKEMHVGHLRSTNIGDALVRVLEHLGGTVVRQNHIGDWGTQFGMLIQYADEHPADDTDLDATYRAASAMFQADPAFADRSRRRVVALQSGDAATVATWRAIVAGSTRHFTAVYETLGARLTPADIVGESFYNDALPAVADDLARAGVAAVSDGALCVFDGTTPLIIRKSDGGFGYAATDLAAIRHRVTTLGADRILYVVDARQALHLRMVFETARRAGWLPAAVDAVHVQFGTVLGTDGRPFRSRAGDTVRLADLLADAVRRARDVVAAKNPGLDPAALDGRARQVGIGALKYADLSTGRTRDYIYDPGRMLALTGNTGVYLQFAHARARAILARADGDTGDMTVDGGPLTPEERALALDLDGFGDALLEVAHTLEPHRLCQYLYRSARTFTAFVERQPVLRAPAGVRSTRLALCALTATTMRTGLHLLGIAAPDRL
jgi:arginyl-tRNA synthetase